MQHRPTIAQLDTPFIFDRKIYDHINIVQLETPVVFDGKIYAFHLDRKIFGETREAVERIFRAKAELKHVSRFGLAVSDIIDTEILKGSLLILADDTPALKLKNINQGTIYGVWGSIRNGSQGVQIAGTWFTDRVIRIAAHATNASSIFDIFTHECCHHLMYLANGSIGADPAAYAKPLQNALEQGFYNDWHAFTTRTKELALNKKSVEQLENWLFNRPLSYVPFEMDATDLKMFRAEVFAYHAQLEIKHPNILSKYSPETSKYLHECLFNHSTNKELFFSANRVNAFVHFRSSHNPTALPASFKDIIAPINVKLPYGPLQTNAAIKLITCDPRFIANRQLLLDDLRLCKVNQAAIEKLWTVCNDYIDKTKLGIFTPLKERFKALEFSKILHPAICALAFSIKCYGEYKLDPHGEWLNKSTMLFLVDNIIYGPLLYVPQTFGLIVADSLYHVSKDIQTYCGQQRVALLNKLNPTPKDLALAEIWENRMFDAGVNCGMLYLAHKAIQPMLTPLNNASNNISNWVHHEIDYGQEPVRQFIAEQRKILPDDMDRQQYLNELETAMRLGHFAMSGSERLFVLAKQCAANSNARINQLRQQYPMTDDREEHLFELQMAQNSPIGIAFNMLKSLFSEPTPVVPIIAPIAAKVGASAISAGKAPLVKPFPEPAVPLNRTSAPQNAALKPEPTPANPAAANENPPAVPSPSRFPAFNPALQKQAPSLLTPSATPTPGTSNPPTPLPPALQNRHQFHYLDNENQAKPDEQAVERNFLEISNVRLGKPNGTDIGIIADFKCGGNIGAGIKLSGSGIMLVISSEIPLGEGFFAALCPSLFYTGLALVVCAGGLYLYKWRAERQAAKVKRHIERHVIATHDELESFSGESFQKQINAIITFAKTNPTRLAAKFDKFKNKLSHTIHNLEHRRKYALKHGAFGVYLGLNNNKYQLLKLKKNVNHAVRLGRNTRKEYQHIASELANTSIDKMITDYYFIISSANVGLNILGRNNAIKASALRDYIIKRCIDENCVDLLNGYPALLDPKAVQFYDLPTIILPSELERDSIKSKHVFGDSFKHKDQVAPAITQKMQDLCNAYNHFKQLVETGASVDDINKAKEAFDKLFEKTENDLKDVQLKDKQNFQTAYDYYKDCFELMLKTVRHISHDINKGKRNDKSPVGAPPGDFDLATIKLISQLLVDHKNSSFEDLIKLVMDIRVKNVNGHTAKVSGDDTTKLSVFSSLLLNKIMELALKFEWDTALNALKKYTEMYHELKNENDENLINVDLTDRIKTKIQFAKDNQHQDTEFWLNALQAAAEKQKVAEKDGKQEIDSELDSDLAANALIKHVNFHIDKGFNQHAADLFRQMQAKDAKLDFSKQISRLEFSHQGQMLDPFVKAIVEMTETYAAGCAPSTKRKIVMGAFAGMQMVQMVVPNAVSFSIQGFYSKFTGDMQTFNAAFQDLQTGILKDLRSPLSTYSGAMLYANLAVTALRHVPFERMASGRWQERLEAVRYNMIWSGNHGLKMSNLAFAAYKILNQPGHALTSVHAASLTSGLINYGMTIYNAFRKKRGEANENPTFYLTGQGIQAYLGSTGTSAMLISLPTTGVGLLVALGISTALYGASTYSVMAKSRRQSSAGEALMASICNIDYHTKQIRGLKEETPAFRMHVSRVMGSRSNIKRVLDQYFSGVKFNPVQLMEANEARIINLLENIKEHYGKKRYNDVIIQSTKYLEGNIANRIITINDEYRIPAHLAWQIIIYRLVTYSESDRHLIHFREQFEDYAQAIYAKAPNAWFDKMDKDVKTQLNDLVKFALKKFVYAASISQTDIRRKEYLSFILNNYVYCNPWYELLTEDFIYTAATIAFAIGDKEKCQLFLARVDLSKVYQNNAQFTHYDMLMLHDLASANYANLLNSSINQGKLENKELTYLSLSLLEKKQYAQVIALSNIQTVFPGKYYAAALATFSASDDQRIDEAFKLLLKETTKDNNYWLFFLQLIQHCMASAYYKDIPTYNDVIVKLHCICWVIAKTIQKGSISAALQNQLNAIINDARFILEEYLKRSYSVESKQPIPANELSKRLHKLVQYWDRCLLEMNTLSIGSEIENILALIAYTNPQAGNQQYFPMAGKLNEMSLFAMFGDSKNACLAKLIAYVRSQTWQSSLLTPDHPAKTILHFLYDYLAVATTVVPDRSQAAFANQQNRVIEQLTALMRSDSALAHNNGGKSLLGALGVFYQKSVSLLSANADGNLVALHAMTPSNVTGTVNIFWHSVAPITQGTASTNYYATLIPVTVRCVELKGTHETPILIETEYEKVARTYVPAAAADAPIGSADDYCALGCKVLENNGDLSNAYRCFSEAIRLNSNHALARYQLANMCFNANQIPQGMEHLIVAKQQNYYPAKRDWLKRTQPGFTADQWYEEGNKYFFGKSGLIQDNAFAYAAYLHAISLSPNHKDALYSLGKMNLNRIGFELTDQCILNYLQKAARLGHERAKLELLNIENKDMTATKWYDLGCRYQIGDQQLTRDDYLAKACFELSANDKHQPAVVKLLLIAHHGFTAEQWYQLGTNYDQGKNGVLQNYHYAHGCFDLAILINVNHINALFALGLLHELGLGVTANLPVAIVYISRAADLQDQAAKRKLISLKIRQEYPNKTAQEYYVLGSQFHNEVQNQPSGNQKARACFEEAVRLQSDHEWSLFTLGYFYLKGLGTDVDLAQAKSLFERAAAKDHYYAKLELINMNQGSAKTADEWSTLAVDYINGTNKRPIDSTYARICCEKALTLNEKQVSANHTLAVLYHYCSPVDLVKARAHYSKSASISHIPSVQGLLKLDNLETSTASQWHSLGDEYYYGHNGKTKDYAKAHACYLQAIMLDANLSLPYFRIGLLYQYGQGVDANIIDAKYYFEQSLRLNFAYSQTQLNIINDEIAATITGDALNALGVKYCSVKVATTQHNLGANCFDRAIALGNAAAFRNKGFFYERGYHYAKDRCLAAKFYQLTIDKGYDAKTELACILNQDLSGEELNSIAVMYHNSTEVVCNDEQAANLYERAIAKLSMHAMRNIGLLYEDGRFYSKDLNKAMQYFKLALTNGYANAQIDIDRVLPLLTPVVVARPSQQGMFAAANQVARRQPNKLVRLIHATERLPNQVVNYIVRKMTN